MTAWIEANSTVLQVFASFATLAVWLFYAQLLFAGFLRQRRPKVVINQVMGLSLKGHCLISNMSAESIHIESVQVWLHDQDGVRRCTVSEIVSKKENEYADFTYEGTLQGPLASGSYLDAGDLMTLMQRARAADVDSKWSSRCTSDECDYELEVLVLYIYSSAEGVMGASRTFTFNNDLDASPTDSETKQYRSYWQRKKMSRLNASYLNS